MSSRSETNTLHDAIDAEKAAQAPVQLKSESKEEIADADPYLCTLDPDDDPKNLPLWRKWAAVLTISSASLCATCTSSMVRVVSPPIPNLMAGASADRILDVGCNI